MNAGDGSVVIAEHRAPGRESDSMVGNPPSQTLPPELVADAPLSRQEKPLPAADPKAPISLRGSHLRRCLETPPARPCDSAPLVMPARLSAASQEKADVPKLLLDGSEVSQSQQCPSDKKDTSDVPRTLDLIGKNITKGAHHAQIHSAISFPHCVPPSSNFKPGQPVAFLAPSANLASPLGKIALVPGLGQIAALRRVTTSHCNTELQFPSSSMSAQIGPYPCHLSLGRALVPTTETTPVVLKPACGSTTSGNKSSEAANGLGPPNVAIPLKQSPLGPATALVTLSLPSSSHAWPSQAFGSNAVLNSPLNPSEKCPTHQGVENVLSTGTMRKSLSAKEDCTAKSPADERDMPLDLSSKSKRSAGAVDSQRKPLMEPCPMEAGQNNLVGPKVLQTQAASFALAVPIVTFPDVMKNGPLPKNPTCPLNGKVSEQPTSWAKSSPKGSVSLTETYVGIASPVLASTLCSTSGKDVAFVEDLHHIARRETISIVDQGEQPVNKDKKGWPVTKSARNRLPSKHPSSCRPTQTQQCQPKDVFPIALTSTAGSQFQNKLAGGKATVLQPAVNQPAFVPLMKAFVQQRTAQKDPLLPTASNCQDALFETACSHPSKSSRTSPESKMMQKPPQTSAFSNEGHCNLTALDPRRPEMAALNTGQQGNCSGEFASFRSAKTKGGKLASDASKGDCSGATENVAEHAEKTVENHFRQKNTQGEDRWSSSAPIVHTQVFGDCCPIGEATPVQEPEDQKNGGRLIKEGLSPCVKLGGVALSILTGQCTDASELERGEEGRNGVKETHFRAKTVVNKCRDNDGKDKSRKDLGRKTTACVKKEEAAQLKHKSKKRKKQFSSLEEMSRPEVVGELSLSKAGDMGRALPLPISAVAQRAAPSKSSEMERSANDAPRPKRGRPRSDHVRKGAQSISAHPAPPPVLPVPPQVRRPRGRPRSNPAPAQAWQGAGEPTHGSEGEAASVPRKKRRRHRNRKYQNGEYIVENGQAGEETDEKWASKRHAVRAVADLGKQPRISAPLQCRDTSPEESGTAFPAHSGSRRRQGSRTLPEPLRETPGKRKFKSKHLNDTAEEGKKLKTKHRTSGEPLSDVEGPLSKKLNFTVTGVPSAPLLWTKQSPGRGRAAESSSGRPAPPEVRRLIVNKNAGETLLQRAARLGYQEVVLYCLERDEREVNRRDNAGYTALHEACARGWERIVRVLLEHGADVNCSAQDGTRPIHDAVVNDNLDIVWMLLNHGADPTLATYSGQTALKLAQSSKMQSFLTEYFADLEGRAEQDPSLHWNFYSSAVFETDENACWDFLLMLPEESEEEEEEDDFLMFEFSAKPLLPCYHVEVSLSQDHCNWFLLSDVLKQLKTSSRVFRTRYPHFEVVNIPSAELCRQVALSQITPLPRDLPRDEGGGLVELVRCVPDLQRLLGSTVQSLGGEELSLDPARPR